MRKKTKRKKHREKESAQEKQEQKELTREVSDLQQRKGILKYPTNRKGSGSSVSFFEEKTIYSKKRGNSFPVKKDNKIPKKLMDDSPDSDLLNIDSTIKKVDREIEQCWEFLFLLPEEKIYTDTRQYLFELINQLHEVYSEFVHLKRNRATISDEDKTALYRKANLLLRDRRNMIQKGADEEEEENTSTIKYIERDKVPVSKLFSEKLSANYFDLSYTQEAVPQDSQEIVKELRLTSQFSDGTIFIPGQITLYLEDNNPKKILRATASNALLKYMLEYNSNLTDGPYNLRVINQQDILQPGDLMCACERAKEEETELFEKTLNASSSAGLQESDEAFNQRENELLASTSAPTRRNAQQSNQEDTGSSSSAWQVLPAGSAWRSNSAPTLLSRQADSNPKGKQSQARKGFEM